MGGILSFLSVVSLLYRQIFARASELIKADLRLSDFQLGMMQGLAFAVSFSLFALPIGALVDRCARRWILFAGVLFWGAAPVDRKSVVSGKSVSVRVDIGGRRIIKNKITFIDGVLHTFRIVLAITI